MNTTFGPWLAAAVILAAAMASGCWDRGNAVSHVGPTPARDAPTADSDRRDKSLSPSAAEMEASRPVVSAFCGDCHPLPLASSFAKADWRKEVERGFDLYRKSGRQDLVEPSLPQVVAFFEAQAPEQLDFPVPPIAEHASPFRFRTQIGLAPQRGEEAGVSSLVWQAPTDASPGKLLLCDMRGGRVGEVKLDFEPEFQQMASLKHAALLEPSDLDEDGREDYLVGELGSYLPQDHERGEVVWLRQDPDGGWKTHVLAEGLGRVSQAIDGDFDGDGERDIVVAEFGWITTGSIRLLKRSGDDEGIPRFESSIIDPRHGASHLRKVDWDGDGDLDFAALISQEHEKVELFLNDGKGQFHTETIFAAPDPNFGSSGIELIDLDADGDLDVLHTNGDAVDSFQVKPFHAVRWLENEGRFPFRERLLTTMPGVYKAVAADFEDDGDLDIAALAFPPEAARMEPNQPLQPYDLMVFLEQTAPGQFARHPVKITSGGLAMAAGDFDGDGDTDLATGQFGYSPTGQWLTIWWNKSR